MQILGWTVVALVIIYLVSTFSVGILWWYLVLRFEENKPEKLVYLADNFWLSLIAAVLTGIIFIFVGPREIRNWLREKRLKPCKPVAPPP